MPPTCTIFNPETLIAMGQNAGLLLQRIQTSSDGGVITAIFTKGKDVYRPNIEIPGNHEKIAKILKEHTMRSHYLSPHPYFRPLKRLGMLIDEMGGILKCRDGKAVLDRLIREIEWELRDRHQIRRR